MNTFSHPKNLLSFLKLYLNTRNLQIFHPNVFRLIFAPKMYHKTTPTKRKAEEELSMNPHTVKAREYQQSLNEDAKRIANAKHADTTALSRARGAVEQSDAYRNADRHTQKQLLDQKREEVITKR
jgi:hypothetical protein